MDYDLLSPVQGRAASAIAATSAPVYVPDQDEEQDFDVPYEIKDFVEPPILSATLERAVQAAALEPAAR